MRQTSIVMAAVLAVGVLAAKPPANAPAKELVVHEWGTFLTMNGSDGVTLDGMYHEEHALPSFVHSRSNEELFQHDVIHKGETPVIYFYTQEPQRVSVKVSFPRGVWTQWFPQAARILPKSRNLGNTPASGESSISWQCLLSPPHSSGETFSVRKTAPNALWNYARNVDADYVMGEDLEIERFLFYRGLGKASLPLGFTNERGGTLSLSASDPNILNHLFVIRVEHGKGAYKYFSSLNPGNSLSNVIPDMAAAKPIDMFTREISDHLADSLTSSGLYAKEARAMVNTWTNSYFKTDGVRVLYLLPQRWTDRFIPMEIQPRPTSIVRVMVGRTELLMPERERKVAEAVRNLASDQATLRNTAFLTLQDQGRYLEPILRREAKMAADAEVRRISEKLLHTNFVNQIRPNVYRPDDGVRKEALPADDAATFSALLKEIHG